MFYSPLTFLTQNSRGYTLQICFVPFAELSPHRKPLDLAATCIFWNGNNDASRCATALDLFSGHASRRPSLRIAESSHRCSPESQIFAPRRKNRRISESCLTRRLIVLLLFDQDLEAEIEDGLRQACTTPNRPRSSRKTATEHRVCFSEPRER